MAYLHESHRAILSLQWHRMGVVQIHLSMAGQEQIAESLSQVALTEIIAVVVVYAAKSIFENLSKNSS